VAKKEPIEQKSPRPFIDPPPACRCQFCKDPAKTTFIEEGLKATKEAGAPRPQVRTIANAAREEFGHCLESTMGRYLKLCSMGWKPGVLWDE